MQQVRSDSVDEFPAHQVLQSRGYRMHWLVFISCSLTGGICPSFGGGWYFNLSIGDSSEIKLQ